MNHIKSFEDKKRITFYHGLGGERSADRMRLLRQMGYEPYFPNIDFDDEWYYDECKSLFLRELDRSKNSEIIMGTSLGGYLAYNVAKALDKECVLINPSINREMSKLNIREFDMDYVPKFPKIKVFFGELDDYVIDKYQIETLEENGDDYEYTYIKGMEHWTPIDKLKEILELL